MGRTTAKIPHSTKLELITNYLRGSRTCHTLKDLEKSLPSVASMHAMQVKEHLQELIDENQIRVEKIGSVNWYWVFEGGREERHRQEEQLAKLEREIAQMEGVVGELEGKIEARRELLRSLGEGEEDDEGVQEKRRQLMQRRKKAEEERDGVQRAWESEQKQTELARWRAEAQGWTENIWILEGYLAKLAGGDRALVAAVQQEEYGSEYDEEGGGLRELPSA